MKNTFLNVNGYDVEISTNKGNNGITCNAIFGKCNQRDGYTIFEYAMFQNPSIILAKSAPGARATQKTLETIHAAGLAQFNRMREAGELPKNEEKTIQPGQVLTFIGYGHETEKLAVYETDGNTHKVVNMDTLQLKAHTGVRHISKKFGIGVYFTDEILPLDIVLEAVEQGKEKAAQEARAKEEKQAEATEQRRKDIEIGAAILSAIPDGITHIIIAEHRVNKSDPMTDYFAHDTTEIKYLAWSRHDRNLFDEMRKAAANSPHPEINKYATKPEGEAKDEHRENYSGGSGYYLGNSKYSGWVILKKQLTIDKYWGVKLEDLQIAISQNRYHIPAQEQETPELPEIGNIKVVDYSEKAIAVTGDTRAIKDNLRSLGGAWCGRGLNVPERQGWIFPKSRTDSVISYLKTIKSVIA